MAEPTKVQSSITEEPNKNSTPKALADRQAAAALSRLDQQHLSSDDTASSQNVDKEALGEAMKGLNTSGTTNGSTEKAAPKKVKLDGKEVEFLMGWCDVSKKRAEGMLREAEGDGDAAVKAFVMGGGRAKVGT